MTLYGAAAILHRENKIVLVKHGEKSDHPTGSYSLTGGRSEPTDATTIDTIVRETREETGLELDKSKLHLIGRYDFSLGGKAGNRSVSVDLYAYEIGKDQSFKNLGYETMPEWVGIDDFISGKYPLSFTSDNFNNAVKEFVVNLSS